METLTFDLSGRDFDDATDDLHGAVRDWADRNDMEWFDESGSLDEAARDRGQMRTLVKVEWNKHITVDEYGNVDMTHTRKLKAEEGEVRITESSLIVDAPSEDRTRSIRRGSFPIDGR